jgi:hypothetical protein
MTDLVPAPLVSRQATNHAPPPAPLAANLSEVERVCNMIAAGGEMVPPAYRGKPGAVLLAKLWGDANGVDLFTAIQNISPIEGKPYVAAEMRVALAVAKGFEFRTIEATREVCTLEVWRGPEKLGTVTARIGDQPRKLKTAKGYDTPWATHPDDMLFAEACRKADRRHVRTAAALLDAGQDYDPAPDPLMVLARQAPLPPPDDEPPLAGDELTVEPEPWDDPPPTAAVAEALDDRVTEADLLAAAELAGLKPPRVKLLKHAQTHLGWSGGTLEDIVADQDVAHRLLHAVGAGEL